MLGRSPPGEDGAATEPTLMDEWVQELPAAQEEARRLIAASIEGNQQGWVDSTPHRSRTWRHGEQVMLREDCKCKGKSWKLSKKWSGPYRIVEVLSPQVVVLEEPNSHSRTKVNVERIKPFKASPMATQDSGPADGHYKVKEVLEEWTVDNGKLEYLARPTHYWNAFKLVVQPRAVHRLVGGSERGPYCCPLIPEPILGEFVLVGVSLQPPISLSSLIKVYSPLHPCCGHLSRFQ